jgi:hypothetical protein
MSLCFDLGPLVCSSTPKGMHQRDFTSPCLLRRGPKVKPDGFVVNPRLMQLQFVENAPSDASAISERSIADVTNAITSLWCAEAGRRERSIARSMAQIWHTTSVKLCQTKQNRGIRCNRIPLFLRDKMVERRRIELPTFALRTRRSPS